MHLSMRRFFSHLDYISQDKEILKYGYPIQKKHKIVSDGVRLPLVSSLRNKALAEIAGVYYLFTISH